jgi:hypothetical protein
MRSKLDPGFKQRSAKEQRASLDFFRELNFGSSSCRPIRQLALFGRAKARRLD